MPKKITQIDFEPGDITVDVRFDERTGTFSAWYLNKEYTSNDFTRLKEQVLAAIQTSFDLSWTSIIEVTTQHSVRSERSASFYLSLERKYIAHHPKMGSKQVHWECLPEGRFKACTMFYGGEQFDLPSSRQSADATHLYLPDTEEEWERLQEIRNYLHIAIQKTSRLLEDPEGIEQLLATSRSLFDHFATQHDDVDQEGSL